MSIHGDHPQEVSDGGTKAEFPDFGVTYGGDCTTECEVFDGNKFSWQVSDSGVLGIIRVADDEPVEAFAPGFWHHVGEIRKAEK